MAAIGIIVAASICFLTLIHPDTWGIRSDLHLGLSRCIAAQPTSGDQTERVAVAAISDKTKDELQSRFEFKKLGPPVYLEEYIPWYADLSISTESQPVLERAKAAGHTDIRYASTTIKNSNYDLVLDCNTNILWIVRDVAGAVRWSRRNSILE
ncbi:MAG TPA: hypothetical protein VG733_09230 [Chthoniobacteraceae bacterium]|nr:hypothetical protein [Chthoniobacteraceae bacterium]